MLYITDLYRVSDKFKKEENQDACFFALSDLLPSRKSKMLVSCVVDGVSNANGKAAAALATRALHPALTSLIGRAYELCDDDLETRKEKIYATMRDALLSADAYLRAYSKKEGETACTASVAVVLDETVYTCNVGDSPILLLRSNMQGTSHKLIPLFQCHNSAGLDVARGLMSKEEALSSPAKNDLIRYLGGRTVLDEMQIFFSHEYLGRDNVLLLGSDGALSVLSEDELYTMVLEGKSSLCDFSKNLYDKVFATSAKDNFTLVASHLELS